MKTLTRDEVKKLFKKKISIPDSFDNEDFSKLKYYSWLDTSSNDFFMIYEYKGKLTGIKFDTTFGKAKPLAKGFCDICQKQKRKDDVIMITSQTKKKPKGVDYRTRGINCCIDCHECNSNLETSEKIDDLFYKILEQE